MQEAYVFDACALIALFTKEPGWEKVHAIQTRANQEEVTVFMHNATVAEVYYDALRRTSREEADELANAVFEMTVRFVDRIDVEMIRKMGYYKTRYKVSFADCFVLAIAETFDAAVVTSDRHEFGPVEADGKLNFHWIR